MAYLDEMSCKQLLIIDNAMCLFTINLPTLKSLAMRLYSIHCQFHSILIIIDQYVCTYTRSILDVMQEFENIYGKYILHSEANLKWLLVVTC